MLAIAGVVVGLGLLAASLYIAKYNPFHLPTTLEQAREMGSYSEPAMLSFLQDASVVLCPGLVLELPLSDAAGYRWQLFIWVLAAAINGVLYYWLGRGIVAVRARFRHRHDEDNHEL